FSALNIVGLAIGMAACIVIMVFVFYERSFDSIHTKNIYRLDEVQKFPGMVAPQNVALSMFPMGPTLKTEFPEVVNFTRIARYENVKVFANDKISYLPKTLWVDSTFLDLFDFKLTHGDRKTVLLHPNSILLTSETAIRLFGTDDAIGKTLQSYGNDTFNFKVTGILANTPANSHLQFDGLLSFSTRIRPDFMDNWGGNWLTTYLQLTAGADIASMEKRFPAFLKRHMSEDNDQFYSLYLQALKDVHASSADITHDYINFQKFDKRYTYIFSVIGLIVLVIACINFMNLSTAKSAGRAKEVGVRKSIGANRVQLAMQFLSESILIAVFALLLAIGFAYLLLPAASALSQRELNLPLFSEPALFLGLLGATLLVGLIAGLYPAAYLSSFQPVKVLKNAVQSGSKSLLRNVLVVTQFSGAVFLIIATIFAVRQLSFMQKKDPGFSREQVLVIPLTNTADKNFQTFKQQLSGNTLITSVSASQQRLGNNLHQTGVRYHGTGPVQELAISQLIVDHDFLNLYDIKLVAGRNFRNAETDNARTYIINETLAKELLKGDSTAKIESVLGKMFGFGGMDSSGTIVGVAKDFNFNSLHHKIETLCLFNQKDWGYSEASIKINGQKADEAIAFIQGTWAKLNPDSEFEYKFLDDHFNDLYKADNQVSKIVAVLAVLAIIIACLGLFGLASYSAEKRTKEVGIRKVLGASAVNLVALLSWNFIRLVIISIFIAWAIAWFALSKWLEDFAYRVDISWWVFVLAGLSAILIALLTISVQAMRAAMLNPVKSLRTE
ncbi:MAG: ABC transporter permease, partial [Chitinophagaceae bacterium]|nr:ABC transporter permease [Chitinophagaceae bacterium]